LHWNVLNKFLWSYSWIQLIAARPFPIYTLYIKPCIFFILFFFIYKETESKKNTVKINWVIYSLKKWNILHYDYGDDYIKSVLGLLLFKFKHAQFNAHSLNKQCIHSSIHRSIHICLISFHYILWWLYSHTNHSFAFFSYFFVFECAKSKTKRNNETWTS
jgi:hypothetical protein